MNKPIQIITTALVIIAVIAIAVLARHRSVALALQPPAVTVARIGAGSSQSEIVAEGMVVPGKTVSVALLPGISGQVTRVYVDIGSQVKKGQILAEIDAAAVKDSYAASVAGAQSLAQQYALVRTPYLPEQIDQQRVKVLTDQQTMIEAKDALEVLVKGSRAQQIAADQASVDAAQAQSDTANSALAREKTLFADDLVPKAELETAQTTAQVAADTLNSAQQVLSLAKEGNLPEQISGARAALAADELTLRSDTDQLHLMLKGSRPEQVRQAAANLRAAQMTASAQSVALSHQYVYAPTSGVIIARNISPGESVVSTPSSTQAASPLANTTSGLFTIANNEAIVFQGNVDQMYARSVRPGQTAVVGVEAYPGRTFNARLLSVNPLVYQAPQEQTPGTSPAVISPSTPLTFTVMARVADPSRVLAPGEQGVLTIRQKTSGLVVPSSAVTSFGVGEGTVYVLHGSTVTAQMIHYTGNLDSNVRVISGLASGDEVVISDTSQLKNGMKVEPSLVSLS